MVNKKEHKFKSKMIKRDEKGDCRYKTQTEDQKNYAIEN